jgi:hypothetical protein
MDKVIGIGLIIVGIVFLYTAGIVIYDVVLTTEAYLNSLKVLH